MLGGEVEISAGGATVSGWQKVRIHRSCEQVPNTFHVSYVSAETAGVDTLVLEGSGCTVAIGGDLVLTGYVDVVQNDADATSHELSIVGRGKCADLVDCTCEYPTSWISGTTVGAVAAKLAAPYGISVPPPPTDVSLPAFGVTNIESPFTIIEETARFAQLLVYEDEAGDLIFAAEGETAATGALVWGGNVRAANVRRSAAERYSDYVCYLNTTDIYADQGVSANIRARDYDSGVTRHRLLGMVLEAPSGVPGQDFAAKRVAWERSRRAGRGRQAIVTVVGWRDGGGALWAPNTRATLYLPKHGVTGETWVIGDVTYLRDEEGTRTELMLMPLGAFQPQPELLTDPNVADQVLPDGVAPQSIPSDLTVLPGVDLGF